MPMDLEPIDSLELDKEEATHIAAEDVHLGTLEEQAPPEIVREASAALRPQEEVAESESSNDREGSNNIPTNIVEENRDKGENKKIIRLRSPVVNV